MGRRGSSDLVDNPFIDGVSIKIQPYLRGYIQRLHAFWKEKGLFPAGEQRLCEKVRIVKKVRLAVATATRVDKETCRKW